MGSSGLSSGLVEHPDKFAIVKGNRINDSRGQLKELTPEGIACFPDTPEFVEVADLPAIVVMFNRASLPKEVGAEIVQHLPRCPGHIAIHGIVGRVGVLLREVFAMEIIGSNMTSGGVP